MAQAEESCQEEPEFITYLLSPELKHDTYFIVGKDKVEKIGAVRKMLAAHSAVLRAELEDSEIKEKGDIIVNDIFPGTFRNLLKFVYGYNNVLSLTFEEADDLLYAADKYFLVKLKKQLTLRLMVLLNSQNVCSLLNNPVCHVELELNAKITEILQFETQDVLASPHFLNLRTEGFIKILEQECLNVPEIQLFRSALTWAKTRVSSEDGNELRKHLEELKHIRICTISLQDFLGEVVPSGILTSDELFQSCVLYGKKEIPPAIDGFSNKTEPRFDSKRLELPIPMYNTSQVISVSLMINTKCSVGLFPMEVQSNTHSSLKSYRCVCNVEISNESNQEDPPITIKFDELVDYGKIFKIPRIENGMFLTLPPNATYKINIYFNEPHTVIMVSGSSFSNTDLSLKSLTTNPSYGGSYTYFPFKSLKYLKAHPI